MRQRTDAADALREGGRFPRVTAHQHLLEAAEGGSTDLGGHHPRLAADGVQGDLHAQVSFQASDGIDVDDGAHRMKCLMGGRKAGSEAAPESPAVAAPAARTPSAPLSPRWSRGETRASCILGTERRRRHTQLTPLFHLRVGQSPTEERPLAVEALQTHAGDAQTVCLASAVVRAVVAKGAAKDRDGTAAIVQSDCLSQEQRHQGRDHPVRVGVGSRGTLMVGLPMAF